MWPRLFELRLPGLHLGLPTYGALVALGFSVGVWLATRAARRQGLPERSIADLCFSLLLAGLVGARLLYVAVHAREYVEECARPSGRGLWRAIVDCTRVVQVWEGGLVFYGGLLAALPALVFLARRRGIAFLPLADALAPSLSIAHFFGRLGCFFAGCCWGKVCHCFLGVRFPAASMPFPDLAEHGLVSWAALETPPLHPTQLYEAAGELLIFALLTRLAARKRFSGQVMLTYAAAYAVLRAVVEIFRGDGGRGFVWSIATPALNRALGLDPAAPTLLSTSQFVSLVALLLVVPLWLHLRSRNASSQVP
jgi:phosphatidylglycerol---prolipoprotein diacylglyceryl transferase